MTRDRAGARLADRHARRREGARGAVRAVPRRRPAHAGPRARQRVAADRAPPDPDTSLAPAPAAAFAGSTATACRSSPSPSSCSTSTATIWSSARATAPPRRWWPGRAPGTSAIASRRCATRGISSTSISARSALGAVGTAAGAAGAAPAGAVGCRARPAASTAMWLFHIMLQAESADTIIVESDVVYPPVDTDVLQPGRARVRKATR